MNWLSFDKTERTQARHLKKAQQLPTAAESWCSPFTFRELNTTIHAMQSKGAVGPDDIPPTFLKALGLMAKAELLSIINESFYKGVVPGIWKEATILPLKKAGKPPGAISSYRPASLTSCVVKIMERMVHNRLYNLAERRGWLCSEQAGFRKLRSCEDQILRDGFQAAKPQHSLMALLDFSKAFDRVWREELPAHPEHLDRGGCQMPTTRLPHLEGVGVEKGPADEGLQSSAAQPPNLRGSGVATLGRPFPHRAAGALPKQSREGVDRTTQIHPTWNTPTGGRHLQHRNGVGLECLSPSHAAAVSCTDSQSFLKAIQSGSADTTDLRRMLNKRAGKTTLLWIPGHHGIAGNKEADACGKHVAAIIDGAPRPVSFAAASALTCRTLTDPPPCYRRTKEVYTKTFHARPTVGLSPRDATRRRSPRPSTSWSHHPPQDLRQSAWHDSRP